MSNNYAVTHSDGVNIIVFC